jgi:hypothetical protein
MVWSWVFSWVVACLVACLVASSPVVCVRARGRGCVVDSLVHLQGVAQTEERASE